MPGILLSDCPAAAAAVAVLVLPASGTSSSRSSSNRDHQHMWRGASGDGMSFCAWPVLALSSRSATLTLFCATCLPLSLQTCPKQ